MEATGASGDREGERDAILRALAPVVEGIAATFGPVCEVVLHDYRRPERSVAAVAGSVTGRTVGGAMSEIGMRVLARGDDAVDELNYVTRTAAGKLVKSSTMVLRDSAGAVFGALCVNVDVTEVDRVQSLLTALAGSAGARSDTPVTTFGDDIDSVVDALLDAHLARQDQTWAGLDGPRRLALFRGLDERGVFAVRRAVEQIAARLGISRASAYNYLSRSRAARDADGSDSTPEGAHP
ncbi:PAS domain-containing protein [Streptomyces sp. IBSBF 2953]|uniref:helix-turn-helix transcriptional regulator n=1 Tax=Streptomyces TaxID=1883 RepID=UPI00211A6265|nr:PAS domain-containing protein [Streptomyces scabiei]MCQ9181550.1 PAS domain-containing protein [Streptomyces hayashii]MDX3112014.1 PAS domain-containing protein [Streptomyces scabiei]